MAFDGGIDWVAVQAAIHEFVVACTGLPAEKVYWAQQQGFRPAQPAIVMRLSVPTQEGLPWIDSDVNYLEFNDILLTSVDATANTFTKVGHGLATGTGPVRLAGLDLPGGTDDATDYWVIRVDADTFKLADGFVNAMNLVAVDISDAGSGDINLTDTTTTLVAGEEIIYKSRAVSKVLLNLECYAATGVGVDMAVAMLWRIEAKRLLPSKISILRDANISISSLGRILAIHGTQDLVLYEPRASVDIVLNLVSEDSEEGTIIERTEITNDDTGDMFTVDVENDPF